MHRWRSSLRVKLCRRRCFHASPRCLETVSAEELAGCTVSYVTDVEGNLNYWNRWVAMSSVLCRDETSRELVLDDNCHVVYGGDVWDRGPGDLRIIRDIVSLKNRYPSRVHIVLGNRDINKIRLISELKEDAVTNNLITYWTIPKMYIKNSELSPTAIRLRMILEKTMGCPLSFQYRREELQELGVIKHDDTEKEQGQKIVKSYVEALLPGGLLFEYLRLGSVALLLNDCLFVHGGFHPSSLGWVPNRQQRLDFVQDWVRELQAFHDKEIDDMLDDSVVTQRNEDNPIWSHLYEREEVLRNPYVISSDIVRGFQRGSTELGFPTANLNLDKLKIKPMAISTDRDIVDCKWASDNLQTGVYVGYAHLHSSPDSRYYPCVYSVGWNPTYENKHKTIEAHLLDVDMLSTLPFQEPSLPSDFYGAVIDIYTLVYLRDETKFNTTDELISCIKEDISRAQGYMFLMQQAADDEMKNSERSERDEDNLISLNHQSPFEIQPWAALGGYCSPHPGSRLLQYGMGTLRGRIRNPTVIYNNFLCDGSPQFPHPEVLKYLKKSEIAKVFSGHQPHGDSPVVINKDLRGNLLASSSPGNIQFFTGDTSYSRDVHWVMDEFETSKYCMSALSAQSKVKKGSTFMSDSRDTRGVALAEICIRFAHEKPTDKCTSSSVSIKGFLSNNIPYHFEVDDLVGTPFGFSDSSNNGTSVEWWVKGYINSDELRHDDGSPSKLYIVCKSVDRDIYNAIITEDELRKILRNNTVVDDS